MANARESIENMLPDEQLEYTEQEGGIRYLDSSALRRPFEMPRNQRIIALLIVIVAAIIGIMFLYNSIYLPYRENVDEATNVETNLAQPGAINAIPIVTQFTEMTDEEVVATFDSLGYKTYDVSSQSSTGGVTVYKVPDNMTVEEVAALYAKGVDSLTATQASRLLNGSWYFSIDRDSGLSLLVRYADFQSGSEVAAVQAAVAKEGFDAASVTGSGVDDAGNTYQEGTVTINDSTYTWRVSAIPLSEVYSISGLPDDAIFVGIRLTLIG